MFLLDLEKSEKFVSEKYVLVFIKKLTTLNTQQPPRKKLEIHSIHFHNPLFKS